MDTGDYELYDPRVQGIRNREQAPVIRSIPYLMQKSTLPSVGRYVNIIKVFLAERKILNNDNDSSSIIIFRDYELLFKVGACIFVDLELAL
jgi:hypothetical protein